ncbi:PREDICTED: nuclear pore complex protein Nup107-like [Priapulus caudatus]|uniref:Nuclear pore complex protein n=1 Tax=Priapulus caudatus TaxID=37621 RepID=A0ABM1E9K5_PRICU|nr:PREDICTED: nuclear pore complex protein Nup107-like [Priapulus caudatus]
MANDPNRFTAQDGRDSFDALMATPEQRQETKSRAMRRSIGVNLQKSLQILDEAIGSPPTGSILRTKRRSIRQSMLTPSQLSESRFDSSAVFGNSFNRTPGASNMIINDSLLDPTVTLHGDALQRKRGFNQDLTTTNVTRLLEDDPNLAGNKALSERVQLMQSLVQKAAPGQARFQQLTDVLLHLTQERDTWELIRTLFFDRLQTAAEELDDADSMEGVEMLDARLSDKDIVNNLFKKEAPTRQNQLVIDWLELSAAQMLSEKYDRVEFFADNSVAWENTLMYLHQRRENVPIGHDRPIVTELDPDAPIRQNRPLADLDREDEARLLKNIFVYIRAGQLHEAEELCVKCGQAWRAATLEGWRLHHDPNYADEGGSEGAAPEGNVYRDIWKAVCWRLSQDERLNLYERAMYGAFSGNLPALLPACPTWEDRLWAYYRTMVDARTEQEIRTDTSTERPLEQLPSAYWNKMLTPEVIFQELQASREETIREQATKPFHVVQRCVIVGDTDTLVDEAADWVSLRPPAHLLRFLAHLVLFLRTIGAKTKEHLCISILEAYVQALIECDYKDLVAFYTSTLPQERQVAWYAKFLEGISEREERQHCLTLARDAGLDVPLITKTLVEVVRTRDTCTLTLDAAKTPALEAATSNEDRQKIEVIDWLVFDESQRAEAMKQANAVMRTFIALKKHSAAREVFRKIPPDSIDLIVLQTRIETGSDDLMAEDDNAVREYLCHQAYLDAQTPFNDWFQYCHHGAPSKPRSQWRLYVHDVACEHRSVSMGGARGSESLADADAPATSIGGHNVLSDSWAAWMRDRPKWREIAAVRVRLLLPCSLVLKQKLETDGLPLFSQVFQKEELRRFLEKMRDSSVALMEQGMDPQGYEPSR